MLRIATWNVNSIRKRLPLLLDWLALHQPDVMCLQETKVQDSEFPADALLAAGYHARFRGCKAYNGVATLTRSAPEAAFYGFLEGPDSEDVRVLEVVVSGLPVLNTYVPQGYRVGSEKYACVAGEIRKALQYIPPDRLIVSSDCGFGRQGCSRQEAAFLVRSG